jgi:hypothetical protein
MDLTAATLEKPVKYFLELVPGRVERKQRRLVVTVRPAAQSKPSVRFETHDFVAADALAARTRPPDGGTESARVTEPLHGRLAPSLAGDSHMRRLLAVAFLLAVLPSSTHSQTAEGWLAGVVVDGPAEAPR